MMCCNLLADELKRSYMAAIGRLQGKHAQQIHSLEAQLAKQAEACAVPKDVGDQACDRHERGAVGRVQGHAHELHSMQAALGSLVRLKSWCFLGH